MTPTVFLTAVFKTLRTKLIIFGTHTSVYDELQIANITYV